MLPLVSVIIPTYNRSHLLGETLDSLIAQTYFHWECLVVDDGSVDNTEELMQFYQKKEPRIKFYRRPHSRMSGGNAARNYGFEKSAGDFIQWFDSDNVMLPNKLELKVEAISKDGEADFVVCQNAEIINEKPLIVKEKWPIKAGGDVLFNHFSEKIAFDTNGPMFRKEFLADKALFDETILIGQDWEFFSRLLVGKPKILYLFEILYYLRTLKEGVRETKNIKKISSKIQGELKLLQIIRKSQYFEGTDYQETYNRIIFYRILSRYQYIKKNVSAAKAWKYLLTALPQVNSNFLLRGLKKSVFNKKNISNIRKILKNKK